jgi:hypothetical protein
MLLEKLKCFLFLGRRIQFDTQTYIQTTNDSRKMIATKTCRYCRQPGHTIAECVSLASKQCLYCKDLGHSAKRCHVLGSVTCRYCREYGHRMTHCPALPRDSMTPLDHLVEWDVEINRATGMDVEDPFWYFKHTSYDYLSAECAAMRASVENQVEFQTYLFHKYGEGWLRETHRPENTPENCPYLEDLRYEVWSNKDESALESWCDWDELLDCDDDAPDWNPGFETWCNWDELLRCE